MQKDFNNRSQCLGICTVAEYAHRLLTALPKDAFHATDPHAIHDVAGEPERNRLWGFQMKSLELQWNCKTVDVRGHDTARLTTDRRLHL